MVRFAINESLKLIESDNATLAMDLQHNFENKFEELRKEINWKNNQTITQWVQEPIVKQKMTRDLRNKALDKIKEIPLDGLNKQELDEITIKLKTLEEEIKNQDIKLGDLMKKRIVKLKQAEFNKTVDESKYLEINEFPIRSDMPTAQAFSAAKFPSKPTDPNIQK